MPNTQDLIMPDPPGRKACPGRPYFWAARLPTQTLLNAHCCPLFSALPAAGPEMGVGVGGGWGCL